MLLAFIALYYNARSDGTSPTHSVTHNFSHPISAASTTPARVWMISRLSLVKVCWVALFVGFAIKIPMFPVPPPGCRTRTSKRRRRSASSLAGVPPQDGHLRHPAHQLGILPEATAWAAPAMAAFGTNQHSLRRVLRDGARDRSSWSPTRRVSHMGFCLLRWPRSRHPDPGVYRADVQPRHITAMLFTLVGVI